MNWKKVSEILRLMGTLVGFGIFVYLIITNINELNDMPVRVKFEWDFAVLAVFLYLFVYFLQMINLRLIYISIGQKINLLDVVIGFSVSLLPKYIPGYIWGYFSRGKWFENKKEIPAAYSWGAAIIELLITISTGLVTIGVYLLWQNNQFLWMAVLLIFIPILEFYFLKLVAMKILMKILKLDEGIRHLTYNRWLIFYINSLFQWIILGSTLYLLIISSSIQLDYSWEQLFTSTYIFTRSWLTGFLAFIIPNGLGVRELILKDLLTVGLGIQSEYTSLIATISRLLLFLTEGLWILVGISLTKRGKTKNNPNVLLI